jgi:hypothetical protein
MLPGVTRTAVGGGMVAAVLGAGWVGAVAVTTVAVVFIAAVCWVVADPHRPRRLALLLSTWHHNGPPSPNHSNAKPAK